MIYILIYNSLLICGLASRTNASSRNWLYYICFVGLFFFVGFRYKVGCDWSGYLNIFALARAQYKPASEASFWALNKFIRYFELDYPFINVIAAIGFFAGLHALAKRQPDRLGVLILSFPILILELAMSGIRQGIAVGFLCFGINAFVDTQLIRFVVFLVIAASFHSSAMFFLVLTPFVHGEASLRRMALGALLALPGVFYFLTSETVESYSQRYIGRGTEAAGAPLRCALLALTGVAFLLFLDHAWKTQPTKDYKIVKISSYLMVATFPLSLYSSVAGDRIGFYLYPVQLMILARLPVLVHGSFSNFVAFAPYAGGMLFLLFWTQMSFLFEKCYLPYQFWW